MPLRADGPDIVTRADKKAIARVMRPKYQTKERAEAQAAFTLRKHREGREREDKDNFFSRALKATGRAASSVLDEVGDVTIDPRALSSSGRVRGGGVKARDVANQVGELSGVNSARRIRAGKGSAMDWVSVGATASGPFGRAASAALKASPKLGVISPQMARNIAAMGISGVNLNRPLDVEKLRSGKAHLGTQRLRSGEAPVSGRPASVRGQGDNELVTGDRLAWITNPRQDVSVVARKPNAAHSNIYDDLGMRGQERELSQGFVYQPPGGLPARIVAGSKGNLAGLRSLEQLLMLLSRNLDFYDKDIAPNLWVS